MVTLAEAKNYLRVDGDEDNRLISELLMIAKKLCMDVGRMSEEKFERNEDTTSRCCSCFRIYTKTKILRIFTS